MPGKRTAKAIPPAPNGGQVVGERIRRYRRLRGLTQSQLAKAAKVTKAYVSRLESGLVGAPGREVLQRIADAEDVPLRELAEPLGWYGEESQTNTWATIRQAVMADTRLSDAQKSGLLVVVREFFPPAE